MRTAVLLVALLVAAPPARAQSAEEAVEPDPRAERLNERGKTLFSDRKDYAGAAEMFRRAIAITPDARYYYNLCASLERLERWREALDACDAVFRHQPRGELAQKTGVKAADIREKWRLQRESQPPPVATRPPAPEPAPPEPAPEPAPDPGPRPSPEPPDTGPIPAPGPAETTAIAMQTELPGYRWGIGADVGLVFNGSVGQREYARSGFKLELNAAGLLSQRLRIGLEAFLHLNAFGQREALLNSVRALSIVDLGAALYWHKHLVRQLHLTPLAGLSLSALSVDSRDGLRSYGALGIRLEAGLEWRFPGGRHVLRFVPLALHHYPGTETQIAGDELPSFVFGLDRGGTTWSVTFGYTYRFERAPFPVWNLE